MSLSTSTHLNFAGTARQALEFYRDVFGGTLTVTTYGDVGLPADAPGADRVVFGQLDSDTGFHVMAYDTPDRPVPGATRRENGGTVTTSPFFLSVRADTLEELEPRWAALAAGGTVLEPLAASAWSKGFGMLTDAYGVTWVLDVRA
jgi:PhnB protein